MVFVKFLPQEPNIFNQVHCFLGIHCKYTGFPCFYRVKKLKWKFPRTRNGVGTGAAGQCFHSFSSSLKQFSRTFFFLQGLGILCSPIHGDVGAVTRTVGLKHELIDTSVLKLGIHKSIFCHFLLQQVSTAKRRNKNCLVTATQDQDFLELPLQTIQSNLY